MQDHWRPPPSEALLKLQSMGLELPQVSSIHVIELPYNDSAVSVGSSLDKPLPLEPHELKKRTSSIYSLTTTITEIITMYGGSADEELSPLLEFHPAQEYRDAIAPIFASQAGLHQISETSSNPSKLRMSTSNPGFTTHHPLNSRVDKVVAPTFAAFSRRVRDFHQRTTSSISNTSYECYRKAAFDRLRASSAEPPSSRHVDSDSFLAEPTAGGLMTGITCSYLTTAPKISRNSRSVNETPGAMAIIQAETFDNRSSPSQQANLTSHTSGTSDSLATNSDTEHVQDNEMNRSPPREKNESTFMNDDRWDTAMFTDPNDVLMRDSYEYAQSSTWPKSFPVTAIRRLSSRKSDGSNNTSRRASALLRKLSNSKPVIHGGTLTPGKTQRTRTKQRAISATPYQKYGAEIWSTKNKKTRETERDARKAGREAPEEKQKRRKAKDDRQGSFAANDYQVGQAKLVNMLHRLTRTASQKRRDTLKQSIILVPKDSKEEQSTERAR